MVFCLEDSGGVCDEALTPPAASSAPQYLASLSQSWFPPRSAGAASRSQSATPRVPLKSSARDTLKWFSVEVEEELSCTSLHCGLWSVEFLTGLI